MRNLQELFTTREILYNLTARDVKGKYRRTLLGQLWSLINPIASMIVYTIVFSFIFQARPAVGDPSGLNIYPLWLMCGLLPWLFFTRVVQTGISSLVSNAGLIKKVYFPRMHLPLSVTAATGFTWSIEMGLLSLVLLIVGSQLLPFLPITLGFMALLALFAVGFAMTLSIVNVHFRDMQHFTSIALQMWMYLTPIIYPVTLVEQAAATHGDWILTVYRLNPMERFVTVFRYLLYDNRLPEMSDVIVCVAAATISIGIGYLVFSRNQLRLAEYL